MSAIANLLTASLLPGVGAFAVGSVVMAKQMNRSAHDRYRRYYSVVFPSDLKFDDVLSFVRSLSGMKAHKSSIHHAISPNLNLALGAPPTIVFELEADEKGIRYRLGVPTTYADFVIGQLRNIPSIRVQAEVDVEEPAWDWSIELSTTSSRIPLRIPSPESVVKAILASFSPFKEGEAIIVQWIAASGDPEPIGTDKNQKEKFGDHTFLTVGRIAARGEDPKKLIRRVHSALSSTSTYGLHFMHKRTSNLAVQRRLYRRTTPVVFPSTFNAVELATLIAFPAGNPGVPGLPQGRSRHLPADPGIPSEGFVLGFSNFPGAERPLALTPEDLTMHLAIIGATGSGKTTVSENLLYQEMEQGYGCLLIDPNGDSYDKIKNRIPQKRLDDVVLFDPTDDKYPVGLNVLEGDNAYLAADRVFKVFDSLYDMRGRMSRSVDVLQSSLLTLAMNGLTLMDLPMLLSTTEAGKDFRYRYTRRLDNQALAHFWSGFESIKPSQQMEWASPILHRLAPFNLRPSLRAALGQAESKLSIAQVVREGKIMLVNLAKGRIGDETSNLFAALILSEVWNAAQARGELLPEQRRPFAMHLEEAHNYLTNESGLDTALAEARKYGLCFVPIFQDVTQIPHGMRAALNAHTRSKVIMQVGQDSARELARDLAPLIEPHDLTNQSMYEGVFRRVGSPPATLRTLPLIESLGTAQAAENGSRERYGRAIQEVEAELAERQRPFRPAKAKPNVGWELVIDDPEEVVEEAS